MLRIRLTILLLVTAFSSLAQKLHIDAPVKFLALGDSYTFGQSVGPDDRWPKQLIAALRLRAIQCDDPKIIATSGWRTDDLINALSEDTPANSDYNLVSLLIGVNNYYQGRTATVYRAEFEQLLKTAILLAKGQKQHVFVLSIPDYGYTPFGQADQATITQGIDAFNSINNQVTASYGVPYFNITDISRMGLVRSDLVAGDGLHPSGKQYALWVQKILDNAVIDKSDNPVDPVDTLITAVETPAPKATVYPNPFEDQLIIEGLSDSDVAYTFSLIDVLGRKILERKFSNRTVPQSISTDGLPDGLYFYTILDARGTRSSGKLVK